MGGGPKKFMSELQLSDLERVILYSLEKVGKTYKSEGEWLIKGDSLKIPPDSKLKILLSQKKKELFGMLWSKVARGEEVIPHEFYPEHNTFDVKQALEVVKAIQDYDLLSKFNVSFVDESKFSNIKYTKKPLVKRLKGRD
jgi:hypothetical protein